MESGYGSKNNELYIGANYEDTLTVRGDQEHRFGRPVLAAREVGRGSAIQFSVSSIEHANPPCTCTHGRSDYWKKVSNRK